MINTKIYIGADHRGFELKEILRAWLVSQDYQVEDVGAVVYDATDDYPDYALKVAQKVVSDPNSRGVLLCGSGVGVDMVANKVDGVRAGLGLSPEQIISARTDDDINVLVIATDYINEEKAKKMVEVFLTTEFSGASRFTNRLEKIEEIEKKN